MGKHELAVICGVFVATGILTLATNAFIMAYANGGQVTLNIDVVGEKYVEYIALYLFVPLALYGLAEALDQE